MLIVIILVIISVPESISLSTSHRGIVIALSPTDMISLPYINANKKGASVWASRSWFLYYGLKSSVFRDKPITFCGLNETKLLKNLSRTHSHLIVISQEDNLVSWWCKRPTKSGLRSFQHISYYTMKGAAILVPYVLNGNKNQRHHLNRSFVCSHALTNFGLGYVYSQFDAILSGVHSHVAEIKSILIGTTVHYMPVPVWDLLWQPNLKGSQKLRTFLDWKVGDRPEKGLKVVLDGLQQYRLSHTSSMPLEVISVQTDAISSSMSAQNFKLDIVIGMQPPSHFLNILSSCHVFVSGFRGLSFENRIIEAAVSGAVLLQGPGDNGRTEYISGNSTITADTPNSVRRKLESWFSNEGIWRARALDIHNEAWQRHDPKAVANAFLTATNVTLRALPELKAHRAAKKSSSGRNKRRGSVKSASKKKNKVRGKGQAWDNEYY